MKDNDLEHRWTVLDALKSSMLSRCEEYAKWTIPSLFPPTGMAMLEHQITMDSIGARGVNHLSNKVITTLFPNRLFMRLHVTQDAKAMIAQRIMQQGVPQDQAEAAIATATIQVEEGLASEEKRCSDYLDMVQYRPMAVLAAQLMITTGNALEYHPKNEPVQVFNLRNYCVVRDISGTVIEIMTKQCKAYETFSPAVKDLLKLRKQRNGNKDYIERSDVVVYTRIVLEDDGRYVVYQQADHVPLDIGFVAYTKDTLPWIVLTWKLIPGEDYGRGLVEEYAGAFHALNVLSGSLLNIAAIAGDIKFFVNPASLIDVPEVNKSAPGSWHTGADGDISSNQIIESQNIQFIATMIERYEKQINQAFLLNSAVTRNAERVTAEEIRMQANELETSNGGIYSRLAAIWQLPLANIILEAIDFNAQQFGIVPKVITGMDSLSRQSELEAIQVFLAYMAQLQNVPEDVRATIKVPALAKIVGTNLGVEYQKFIMSETELAARQEQQMQMQQQMLQQQANQESQVAASREAMKGSMNA